MLPVLRLVHEGGGRPMWQSGLSVLRRAVALLAIATVFFVLGAAWSQKATSAGWAGTAGTAVQLRQSPRIVQQLEVELPPEGTGEEHSPEGDATGSAAVDVEQHDDSTHAAEENAANGDGSAVLGQDAAQASGGEGAEGEEAAGDTNDDEEEQEPQPADSMQVSEETEGDGEEEQQQGPQLAGRIPKILHHIFIPADNGGDNAQITMWPHHERWVQNCHFHHSEKAGWEYRLWNASACEALVAEHYPSFLDFYKNNITLPNEKSDMMRYIVLHRYGGLYLDSDVDCWRESSDMLEGYDVVLQGTHSGEGAGSASIASVPGAPLWLAALELVQNRKITYNNWWQSIQRTGPDLLTDSVEHVGVKRVGGVFKKDKYHRKGLVFRVYPAGTWFLPCQWWERGCRRKMYQERAIGQADLTSVVGMHRFAGSWIEGKEDGKGIVNVTEELCNPKPDDARRRMLRGEPVR